MCNNLKRAQQKEYYLKPKLKLNKLLQYGFRVCWLTIYRFEYEKYIKNYKFLIQVIGNGLSEKVPRKLYFYKKIVPYTYKQIKPKKRLIKDLIKQGIVIEKKEVMKGD